MKNSYVLTATFFSRALCTVWHFCTKSAIKFKSVNQSGISFDFL